MSVKKIVLKSIQGLPREGQRCVFVTVRRFDDDNGVSSGYTRRYGVYSVIVDRFDDDNGASSGYTRRYGVYSVIVDR